MAKSIEKRDIQEIYRALVPLFGPNCSIDKAGEFLTGDGWRILVGGWSHEEQWSRDFMVSDNGIAPYRVKPDTRGLRVPVSSNLRYVGRNWHKRMVKDIALAVSGLRANCELRCPLCGCILKWSMQGVDPRPLLEQTGHADCQNGKMVGVRIHLNVPPCDWWGGTVQRTSPENIRWADNEPTPATIAPRRKVAA